MELYFFVLHWYLGLLDVYLLYIISQNLIRPTSKIDPLGGNTFWRETRGPRTWRWRSSCRPPRRCGPVPRPRCPVRSGRCRTPLADRIWGNRRGPRRRLAMPWCGPPLASCSRPRSAPVRWPASATVRRGSASAGCGGAVRCTLPSVTCWSRRSRSSTMCPECRWCPSRPPPSANAPRPTPSTAVPQLLRTTVLRRRPWVLDFWARVLWTWTNVYVTSKITVIIIFCENISIDFV